MKNNKLKTKKLTETEIRQTTKHDIFELWKTVIEKILKEFRDRSI